MAELKNKLRTDLSAAMKERDTMVTGVLRMALSAVGTEEVAGSRARELTDKEVLRVITKETKKREESATAFAAAGRDEQANTERAEADVLRRYIPTPLSDDELAELAREAVAEVRETLGEQPGMKHMGPVMKVAVAKAAIRAEGGRVAAAVKAELAG